MLAKLKEKRARTYACRSLQDYVRVRSQAKGFRIDSGVGLVQRDRHGDLEYPMGSTGESADYGKVKQIPETETEFPFQTQINRLPPERCR